MNQRIMLTYQINAVFIEMSDFRDKCVIVTGAASGFGKAMSEKFAAAGASVVVADINVEGAEAVANSLPGAIAVQIDVADEGQNEGLANAAVEAYGKIDVVLRQRWRATPGHPRHQDGHRGV